MICDLGCTWKETVVVHFDTFSLCFSKATENPQKSMFGVVGVPAEIRTKHLLFIGVYNGKSSELVCP